MFHLNPEDAIRAIQNVARILKCGAPFLFTSGDADAFEAKEGNMNDVTFRYFSWRPQLQRILGDHDLTLVDVDAASWEYHLLPREERGAAGLIVAKSQLDLS